MVYELPRKDRGLLDQTGLVKCRFSIIKRVQNELNSPNLSITGLIPKHGAIGVTFYQPLSAAVVLFTYLELSI